jgi:hypothetical protein
MDSHLTKTEKVLALVAVAVIFAFFGFFILINKNSISQKFSFATDTGINYKMARPDQPFSEYTLEGRELDESYEGLPLEKKKALLENKMKAIAKAKSDLKKKEEEAKKKLVQVKQQKQAKEAQAKALVAARETQLKLHTQAQRNESHLNDVKNAYFAQPANVVNSVPEDAANKKSNKKSYSEWRTQIFASANTDTLSQFVSAYKKGDVTSTELQAMAQDLLDQNDNNYKGLGLALLRSVPSLPSLSQLVHAQPNLPAAYQTYVEQALLAYFYPQNVSYLNAALQTKDQMVQAKVLSLLQANLENISHNDLTAFSDPRSRGTTSEINVSISSFSVLVPALTALSSSQQESALSSMAAQVLSFIQSHNNVAGNL